MRYAVVGAGYFGAELARLIAASGSSVVTVVHSPSGAREVAAEVGARVEKDLVAACTAGDVDAVVVASPNDVHRAPAVAAARAGKHVFCEKPVALSVADAQAMVEEARAAGVVLMAGHVTQFMHGVREARRRIALGEVGELLVASAARTGWEGASSSVSWKKQRARSGGHLFHHIHELDLVLAIMGPARRVSLSGGNLVHHGPGHGDEDDVLLATLEHESGAYSQLSWGSAFRWPEHQVTVQGSLGAVRIDLQEVGVTMVSAAGRESWPLHRSVAEDAERREEYGGASGGGGVVYGAPGSRPPGWLRGIMVEELAWFEEAVDRGGAPGDDELSGLTDGSAALTSVATAEALMLSLAEDRKVSVAEVLRG
ncbi:Gfo/Idh/MocA family protein [Ornithinimicrobium sp. Y1847]|uniref:Gfo/Idh/MocA family protein n=1 Tax=Ornithinimicrobium sp. Y1847 TaxID=3405419 RepID=UPI003B680C1B